MVRMAQEFSYRYLLIDGQGNFGSIDGDSPAAMRYTESRLHKNSLELTGDLDKKTVDYIPTYDATNKEPVVLPAALPFLLLNGAEGIAVGMATKIPPHNLTEVGAALLATIDKTNPELYVNKDSTYLETIKTIESLDTLDKARFPKYYSDIDFDGILTHIKGPDFPTAAEIYDKSEIDLVYTTGRGRVVMRAVAKIEESKSGKYQIIVSELPYQVNKADLVSKIADLVRDKKIEGISDLRDESNKLGIRIVVDIKRDGQPKTILNKLFKYTEMQKAFNANMLALVNGEPKLLNIKRILELFIEHREEITIRAKEFELAKSREREHILEGLMIALDNLDEVISTIRKSPDAETAKTNLMTKFSLSELQSQAILDMQLRKLAALEREKIELEYKEIKLTIQRLLEILSSTKAILDDVKSNLMILLEKYGDERKTKVFKNKVGEFSEEDLVVAENVIVTVSEQGYIKRMNENVYQVQRRGGVGKIGMTTKDEDGVAHVFVCNTHDDILFFTNRGRVFIQKVYQIPEFSRQAKGQAIVNLINVDQGELITSILTKNLENKFLDEDTIQEREVKESNKASYLFMATKNGIVKKTPLSEFENIRANGIISIKLTDNDELIWVKPTSGNEDVILITKFGHSIKFNENDVRFTGRATIGVKGITFKDATDEVIAMDVIRKKETLVLTISENGFGKVSPLEEFPIQKRGGKGVFAARVNSKTGKLACSRIIDHPELELLIMSQQGIAVRIPTKDLPEHSRQTVGVKLIKLKTGDIVTAIAIM
jgi:DNA gyrase subunit A